MNKLQKSFLPVFTFARIDIKRLFRDKVAIFFVFVFPLIFLLIFGSIFRGDGASFNIAVFNESQTEVAKGFETEVKKTSSIKVKDALNLEDAKTMMGRGELDSIIQIPENFGQPDQNGKPSGNVIVYFEESSPQAGQTFASLIQGLISEFNLHLMHERTPLGVTAQPTKTTGLETFDYTFSGILGFTLLSLGIFGPTTVFPRLKQRGVLRRYQTTTIKIWQYFVGNVISNAAVGMLALILMFTAAVVVFDLNMRGSYLNLAIIVLLGVTMLFGIGLALGGWAKNENQAAPLAQLVTLPMMFLSGVFFPTFLMPEFLQKITQFIPLTPIIDSVRLIITENASLPDLGPQLAVIGSWTVIIYIVAFKMFRWE